jgi:PmbA protein
MTGQIIDIADHAVKRATKLGASQAEAYVSSTRSFSIDVENNAIKSANERRDSGCGVRAVVGKQIGFAYVTTIDESDIIRAAEQAVKLAKASVEDPDFESLPSFDGNYPTINGLLDKKIKNLSSEDAATLIVRCVDSSLENSKNYNVATLAQLTANYGQRALVNSLGIHVWSESTSVSMYSYPTLKAENDQTSGYDFQISRSLDDIMPEEIGKNAVTGAIENLGGKSIEGGDFPVIITPLAASTILGNGFGNAVNAEEIQYGRSYISDAFGEQIASEALHIVDDAVLESGIGSRPFDAEGYRSQKTDIISNGVLKGLLHNSYTANKDNVDNTGNASRPGYSGLPSISSSNFVIQSGKGSLDDLIEEVGKGVLCRNTGDRPNMTTGDLSAMVMEGHYFENGEIKHPLRSTLIGINMRDLLKRVTHVGSDSKVTPSAISPSIVIESAKITSG